MKHKPLAEVTLRKYERPIRLEGRELIRKFCLSLGLLQPGDSRDVVIDVFSALLDAKEPLSQLEIVERVKSVRLKHDLGLSGSKASNVRRQVRRLKESLLIEKTGSKYSLPSLTPLHEVFSEHFEKLYVPAIVSRVKEYCEAVEKLRWKNGENVSEVRKSDE